jgi:exopolysaccharide biosynthesis polyprenyl glycosylphosphotransferase
MQGAVRVTAPRGRRGALVRRLLFAADVIGLLLAFVVSEVVHGAVHGWTVERRILELAVLFVISLPIWVLAARWYGLYDRDEERTEHSTTDDLGGVFHLVTVGVWVLYAGAWASGITSPNLPKTTVFWGLAVALIVASRACARALARRSPAYVQNAVIVGAGSVGQLVARKFQLHPEYGVRLVAVVHKPDDEPVGPIAGVEVRDLDELEELIETRAIDRVVIAFLSVSDHEVLELIRRLRTTKVQIDVVPRLFDVVSPNAQLHSIEGLPLMGLPPVRPSHSASLVKRLIDIVVSGLVLLVTSPLLAYIALRVRRSSPGPVLFRQARLGQDAQPFTALKFRTMTVGDHDAAHREYISTIMRTDADAQGGLFKLDRPEVTSFGSWLRKTSLDELPQFFNVLRGDMSLVGPRPCIAYETEFFAPHHFERFLVPQGITGLWQITARARSTFLEALDMDVAYVRGWSLKLDVWIMLRTPMAVMKKGGAT